MRGLKLLTDFTPHAVDIDPAKLPKASKATSPAKFDVSLFMSNPQPAVATRPVAQKAVK